MDYFDKKVSEISVWWIMFAIVVRV
jgi:hypothetical protein